MKNAIALLIGGSAGLLRLVSGLEVELRELYNPAEVYLSGGNDDSRCSPDGCVPVFTRDRSTDESRYWACYQAGPDDWPGSCRITYGFSEDEEQEYVISRVLVAFHPETNGTVDINVDGSYALTFEAEQGSSEFQEITGLAGTTATEMDITGANSGGDWLAILETELYLEVDDVPVVGVTAADRVAVTASATVNDDSAMNTLDGSVEEDPSWSCSTGDVCEIVYDLVSAQSIEQIRIAFVETSDTEGATFNVYYGTSSGVYSTILEGVTAGQRDASIVGLQTYGDARGLGRFVKIEGIPGSGGQFSLAEVDIRLREYEPQYPVEANSAWVESGRLPYGGDSGSSVSVPFDPRPSSEGGCSYGHIEGCDIYYIKDGANTDESRWSCSPQVNQPFNDICQPQFLLNTFRYLKQIKLAFYEGDQQYNEFSIRVRTEYGWALAIPSAITYGNTTEYQTFDLNAWTDAIIIQPRFAQVDEWINVKEMVLLEKKQGSTSTPILSFDLSAADFSSDVISSDFVGNRFGFDLDEAGDEALIQVGSDSQMSLVSAVAIKFPSERIFTFEINYSVYDEDVTDSFTSAGGPRVWERFFLSQEAEVRFLTIVAVEGPDEYPVLRVLDLKVIGEVVSTGVNYVVSTTIKEWDVVTDYIGDGTSDQEEIMKAICDAAGQGFDGADCDGVVTGTPELGRVQMVPGDYYLDGPVFLKSGVDLVGQFSDDNPGETSFTLHGDATATGTDGIINADGVTGVQVSELVVTSNVEGDDTTSVVGNVCFDVKDSEDITMEQTIFSGCSVSTNRWVDSSNITIEDYSGTEDMMVVQRVSDMSIEEAEIYGMLIEDSTGIHVEGIYDEDEFYAYEGFLGAPQEADQSANLVITGSSSDIYLKDLNMLAGTEPRMVVESTDPVTLENVNFEDAEDGECLIEVPAGAGDDLIVLISPPSELVKSGNCFVMA